MSAERLQFDRDQPIARSEAETLQRLLTLSHRASLPNFSWEEFVATIPNDWRPGESDVDDFLNSIRGKAGK